MNRKAFWWILIGLVAVRLVLMALVPVFEPSEARYAAISANMSRSGDFVVPHFTHNLEYQSFDGKPPLVFQAGGLFCQWFGVSEFSVRLFPFLSALLLLAIVFHVVKRFAEADTARLAVIVCATCVAFYAAAGLSMTDMTLTCSVAGALLLYRCFLEDFGLGSAAGVAALLGAGMIVKGPVSLVMFGLPVLADAVVNRRWRGIFNVRWLAVAPVYLLIAVPWFVLVERRNPGSVWYFFYNENFMRFLVHDYGDKYGAGREKFRGVAVLWALVATLPWALVPVWRSLARFLPARFRCPPFGPRGWRSFPLLALLAIVGFWCLTSRVLLYYLFPMVPLFAVWLTLEGPRPLLRRFAPASAALAALVTAGALTGGMFLSDKMRGAATAFSTDENHYAYEFYHGRLPEAKLKALRVEHAKTEAAKAAWIEYCRQQKAEAEAAAGKGKAR